MLQTWHLIKGYVAGAVAFVACPCHLPITLPLLIVLTAGTAFGTWLENNTLTVGVILTIIFIGGIVLAFKWVGEKGRLETGPNSVRPHQTKQSKAKSRQARRSKAKVRDARLTLLARESGSPPLSRVS
jgi:mercuric ion transport protein